MARVLLVIPPCFTNRELDFEIGFPTNLAILGQAVRDEGWDVEYLDMTLEEKEGYDSFAELDHRLEDNEINLVGISNHTVRTSVTTRIVAERIKSLRPDVRVVVGGVNATFMTRELLESCSVIDYVLRGYAQPGVRALLKSLNAGGSLSVPGMARLEDGAFHAEPLPAVLPEDFSSPSFEGLDVARYLSWTKTYPLLTHTGCGFSCNFCTSVMPGPYQSKEVFRPIEDILNEMTKALDLGFERFFMSANIFTSKRDYCMQLCDELTKMATMRKFDWVCMTRVEFVDEGLLYQMNSAGCTNIAFGVETTGRDQWKSLQKGRFSRDIIVQAFDLTKKAGIGTTAYLMLGEPFQTREDIGTTITLMREVDPDYRVISFFQPFPGTPYWDTPEKYGISEIAPLDEWNFHEAPICRTQYLDKSELLNAAISLCLDRGNQLRLNPTVHALRRVVNPNTVYANIPEPAQVAFDTIDGSISVEDVLTRITLVHGNRGRLMTLYWLSAALRDDVIELVDPSTSRERMSRVREIHPSITVGGTSAAGVECHGRESARESI